MKEYPDSVSEGRGYVFAIVGGNCGRDGTSSARNHTYEARRASGNWYSEGCRSLSCKMIMMVVMIMMKRKKKKKKKS